MGVLAFIVRIDDLPCLLLRDFAFNVALRRGEQILGRLEAVNVLKTDGRGPGIRALAHARFRGLVILVKVFAHAYHFGETLPFSISLSRFLLLFFDTGSIAKFRGSWLGSC